MPEFVTVEIPTSESAIYTEAKEKLKALLEEKGITGWEENEADLAIIQLKTIASMFPTLAQIAAVVPPAVFRKFGTELVKKAYKEGAAATCSSTWTLLEEKGEFAVHTIEAGTQLVQGEQVFTVEKSVSVAKGESSKTVTLVASERGTEGNGLKGTIELVDALVWVKEVTIIGETSGGAAQESDEEYQTNLAAFLTLQAPRPITAPNFAEQALQTPSSELPAGVVVGRATSIDGYKAGTLEKEAKVTNKSTKMTEVASFTGITVNTEIIGAGVPKGTYVEKLTAGEEAAKELTMSQEATATEAKQNYKFSGTYENERYTTTFIASKAGEALTSEAMDAVEDYLEEKREVNFKCPVEAPTKNEIIVKTKVHILPTYTEATIKTNIETALKALISQEKWGKSGQATTGSAQWLNFVNGAKLNSTLRYNVVLGTIENITGIAYVFAGAAGLEIQLEGGTKGTADIQMVGPAPLPNLTKVHLTIEFG